MMPAYAFPNPLFFLPIHMRISTLCVNTIDVDIRM